MASKRGRVVLMVVLLMTMTAMLVSRDGAGAKHDDLSADEDTDEDHRARLRGPLAYDDPGLLAFIRQEYLSPPSRLPYNLQRERTDSKAVIYNSYITMDPAYLPMQRLLLKVFEGVRDGFFVEAGAVDGEFLSNTLLLELRQGWTGLLVEADGDTFQRLLERHRRAWASHSCLSPVPHPYREVLIKYTANPDASPMIRMYSRGHGVLASHEEVSPMRVVNGEEPAAAGGDVPTYETVQCLPLASLLLALDVPHVHLVSLDVEGAEEHILKFFPWHRITVDVWLVEHITSHSAKNDHSSSGTSSNNHHNSTHNSNDNNDPTHVNNDRHDPTHTSNTYNHSHANTSTVHNSSPNSNHTHSNHTFTNHTSTNHTSTNHTSTTPHQQQQEGSDPAFVEFFSSKGYVLYPMDTTSLLDNYLFIRRNSSVYRRTELKGIDESRDAGA